MQKKGYQPSLKNVKLNGLVSKIKLAGVDSIDGLALLLRKSIEVVSLLDSAEGIPGVSSSNFSLGVIEC